jgi:hypothetical protein
MTRIVPTIGLILVALLAPAGAQESTTSSRGVYKLLLDNDRVRVFEADFKPGDKLAMRNYPTHLMYTLTNGTLVFAPAGRTAYEVNFKAGEAMWFPPLARATENDSDAEVRVLIVEVKEGAAARAVAAKGKTKAKVKGRGRGKAKGPARSRGRAKKKA